MGDELDFDPDTFFIPGHLWLIVAKPKPATMEALCRSLVRAATPKGPFVPVFTDTDLAYRFIERHGQTDNFEPLSSPTPDEFAVILEGLMAAGYTHLAFDPEPDRARRTRIAPLVESLRNRRG